MDETTRKLERQASLGDAIARERLTRVLIRASGRDPRVDPHAGDELLEPIPPEVPGPEPWPTEVPNRERLTVRRVYRWKSGTVRVKYRTDWDASDRATVTCSPHPGISSWRVRVLDWFVLRVAPLEDLRPETGACARF